MIMRLWIYLGMIMYWVTFPFLFIYLRFTKRTRIVVVSEGKILLVKGWMGNGKWSLPGGGLHYKESPEVGVLRELKEETTIILNTSDIHRLEVSIPKKLQTAKYEFFFAELDKTRPVQPQKGELIDTKWLPIELVNLDNSSNNTVAGLSAWKALRTSDTME